MKRLFFFLVFIIVLILSYHAYQYLHSAYKLYRSAEAINENNTERTSIFNGVNSNQNEPPPVWKGKDRVNILLLGGDSRGLKNKNEVPRSDVLLVASIDPKTEKLHLLSILRDTYVKIPGHGSDRINTALSLGGPPLAMKTVGEFLNMPIHYYVYTDFQGFIKLIDAMGGIDFEVEKDMKYKDSADDHVYDINLKAGMQHLDGKKALQYVRFRHDALSDFSRTERQRNFLGVVAAKLKTKSFVELPDILSQVEEYIETNLEPSDMLKLASLLFDAQGNGIGTAQIPPMELIEETNKSGASVISANKEKLQKYVKQLLNPVTTAPSTE